MRLRLQRFRKHVDYTLDLPEGIVLIKGDSGAGKSTILCALEWVLYGKLQKVETQGEKKRVAVTLTLPDGQVIYRQKHPCLLRAGGLENAEAQAWINQRFGVKELWIVCSYLQQEERSYFLRANNTERLKLLHALSFGQEDPAPFLAALQENIVHAEQRQTVAEKVLQGCEVITETPVVLEDREAWEEKRRELSKRVPELRLQWTQYQKDVGVQETIRHQLAEIVLCPVDVEYVERLRKQVVHARDRAARARDRAARAKENARTRLERERMSKEIEGVPNCKVDVSAIAHQTDEWERTLAMCRKYKIQTSRVSVVARIAEIQSILESDPLKKRAFQIQQRIFRLPSETVEREEVTQAEQRLATLQAGKNVEYCPHCKGTIRITPKGIQPANVPPATQKEITLCEQNAHRVQSLYQQCVERKQLEGELKDLGTVSGVPLSVKDQQALRGEHGDLSSLQIFDPPSVSLDESKRIAHANEIRKRLETMPEVVEEPEDLSEGEPKDLEGLEDELAKAQKELQHQKFLETQRRKLLSQQKDLDESLPLKYQTSTEELADATRRLEEDRQGRQILARKATYDRSKQEYDLASADVDALYRLRKMAKDVECQTLQDTVALINETLERILPLLFEVPLHVSLTLYREKVNKSVTQSVTVNVAMEGVSYDVDQLSGGERDRIGLALTLAWGQVHATPFLLLDECLSSLDSNRRTHALEAIRGFGKLVIVIMHEAIEGYYDHVVEL